MYANQMHREKPDVMYTKGYEISGNILEATSYETAAVRLLLGHWWRSKDDLISDVLIWTQTHGHTSFEPPVRIYLHQHCADNGGNLEDLLGAMDDGNLWKERVREICAISVIWWWWGCIYIFYYIFNRSILVHYTIYWIFTPLSYVEYISTTILL